MKTLLKIIVRTAILFIILVYFLFSLVLMTIGNYAKCDRLETDYVVCQQHETSLDLMLNTIATRLSLPSNLSDPQISYRLKGTEIYNNDLYLETDSEPILYITGIDSWKIEYPIEKIADFVQGRGTGKTTLYLENSSTAIIIHLFICLCLGALVISASYYLDNLLLKKSSKRKSLNY